MTEKWKPYRPEKSFEKVPYKDLKEFIWNNGGPWAGIDLYIDKRRKKHIKKIVIYGVIIFLILLFGIVADFLNMTFWQDFLSNGLATLLGAAAGIPIALHIDRRLQNRKNYVRKKDLLEGIIISTIENSNNLTRYLESKDDELIIDLLLDTTILEATMVQRYALIENYNTNLEIEKYRLLSDNLQKDIDFFNQSVNSSSVDKHLVLRLKKQKILSELACLQDEIKKVLMLTQGEYYHVVESIRITDPDEKDKVGTPLN